MTWDFERLFLSFSR